jgi:hypothetical protein
MNPFELVAAIVIAVIVGRLILTRMSNGEAPAAADTDMLRLRDEVRQLSERIRVLERVITDNHSSAGLESEIERLRDR